MVELQAIAVLLRDVEAIAMIPSADLCQRLYTQEEIDSTKGEALDILNRVKGA